MMNANHSRPMTLREERRLKEKAKIALIAALAPLVDLATLTEGEHGYDYYVDAPGRGYFELTTRLAEIEVDINEKYGVWARVLTRAMAESDAERPVPESV